MDLDKKELKRLYDIEYTRKNKEKRSKQRKEYQSSDSYKEKRRASYQNNKEQISAISKQKYHADKDKYRKCRNTISGRLASYKSSAKQRGIDFLLTEEEFASFWKKRCTYCGAKINTIGLDRIDSSIGYIIGNVTSCCSECNKAKLDRTNEQVENHMLRTLRYMGYTIIKEGV